MTTGKSKTAGAEKAGHVVSTFKKQRGINDCMQASTLVYCPVPTPKE